MGDMALGYGSEFHLLRWLGRHRRLFTEKVCEAADREWRHGWKRIDWLDFEFADGRLVPDSELCGIEFLREADRPVVEKEFTNRQFKWPNVNRKFLMNWDAVGIADDGTYILVEAKAHTEEIVPAGSGANGGRQTIEKALDLPRKFFRASPDADWFNNYYQLANRLYMVTLLEEVCKLKAVFLYVLFTGDHFPGRCKATCPETEEEWRDVLDKEYQGLGLDQKGEYFRRHVIELFLPVGGPSR